MNNQAGRLLRRLLFPLYGLCAVLYLCRPLDVEGATYYVATTGNDSNPGTLNQPFKTFKQAIGLLQPGDTLYVRGGLYTERMDFQSPVRKTGTANAWITVAGYRGETVTLQFADTATNSYGPIKIRGASAYFIFENLVLDGVNGSDGSFWQIRDGNHDFILRNLEIKNFKGSNLIISGHNVQVINCKIHDSTPVTTARRYGIYFSKGDNVVIEGNEIYNQPGGGIHGFPGPINNAIIRNNIIHHNNWMANSNVPGILIFADIDYTQYGPGVIDNVQVYNNLVYSNCVNQPEGSKSCGGIQAANGAKNVKIWNNTVYGNKGYGISVAAGSNGPAVNTVVQNNIVFDNAKGQIVNAGVDSVITHNLTTDPKFVKAEAFDFRLQTHSPAINAGVRLDEVRVDIKNAPRPQGRAYDIGAYELVSDSDSKSPNAPVNLKAE